MAIGTASPPSHTSPRCTSLHALPNLAGDASSDTYIVKSSQSASQYPPNRSLHFTLSRDSARLNYSTVAVTLYVNPGEGRMKVNAATLINGCSLSWAISVGLQSHLFQRREKKSAGNFAEIAIISQEEWSLWTNGCVHAS